MSPDINFAQFSPEELKKITNQGESGAGYRTFQQAAAVNFWKARPELYSESLSDLTMTVVDITEAEISGIEAILGKKIEQMPPPTE